MCTLALLCPLSRSFTGCESRPQLSLTCGLPHLSGLCRSSKSFPRSLRVHLWLWVILWWSWPPPPLCSTAVLGSGYRKIPNKKTNSAATVRSNTLETSAADSLTHTSCVEFPPVSVDAAHRADRGSLPHLFFFFCNFLKLCVSRSYIRTFLLLHLAAQFTL